MTAAKFKPLIFSLSGFALSSVVNIFIFMILLCNHKCTEFGKPHAYREPMCTSENCQWCGEPYFAGAAISIDEILPQLREQQQHWCIQATQQKPPMRANISTP
jgi:hypothetical protein